MRTPTRRLLLIAIPALVAGCFGRGRSASPAKTPAAPAAAPAAPTRDSAVAAPRDTGKHATDSATKAVSDSAAHADSAALAAAKKDSLAKKTPRKTVPATKTCVLDFSDSPPETRLRYQRLPDSTSLTFIGGGVVGHCQGEKNQIKADSAEHYEATGILNMFGNVTYTEPDRMRVEAQHATYFTREERLFADGNVVATQLGSGSTFRGSSIEYLRPMPGSRPTSRLIAPARPVVQIIEKDSLGKPGPPVNVTANTMVDEGDSLLFAWGDVQINRSTLVGESDSASFDKLAERARLIRGARITNRDEKEPFRLFGDTIDLYSRNRILERVVALHNGNASSDDVVMQAERLDLRFVDQKLERAYASGAGRSKATTPSQELEADSLMIRMPGQEIREVRAIGAAVATGTPDTLKIKSDDRDILRGDSVTAWFDSTAVPGDTTKRARMREVHAVGNASSLFQVASKEGPTAPAALNYVRGKVIHVLFDSGQVRDVTVDSSASGLYLEPVPDSLSDSTKGKAAAKGKGKPPAAGAGKPVPATPAPSKPVVPPAGTSKPPVPDSRRRS